MDYFESLTIMTGAVNETESLRETIDLILNVCNHKDLKEILIACSPRITPESQAVVDSLVNMQTDVPVIAFTQNRPGMGAVTDDMERACGSHSLLVPSDLAENLEIIPQMIEFAKMNPDEIISASRWMKGCCFYGYSPVKKCLNYFSQVYLRILYNSKLTDFTNPVQIVPTELYQSIAFESNDFPLLLEMILKPLRLGYRFTEIPTDCYGRKQGKSSNSYRKIPKYLTTSLKIRFMPTKKIIKKDSILYKKLYLNE